jgi:hypothetical protein
MTPGAPTDDEILACLETPGVVRIERRPYSYATSYPLEEVTAFCDDGLTLHLILKDLTWDRLLGDARRTKPRFLYEPRRCIETYRRVLRGSGVGATCHGAFTDDARGRHWILIERVPGVELWQIGDLGTWESIARWLAGFHRSFADEGERVMRRNPHLLRYDSDYLRLWPARALDVAGGDEHRRLAAVVAGYDQVVERLTAVPPSFVHGELYPSNVLVDDSGAGAKVWPIDWEMAGVGAPLLDLAALTAGWEGAEQAKLVDAYLDELGPAEWLGDVDALLDCCRLHYALQWLGWSPEWSPPPEHANDWVAEAVRLGERLGL